MPILKRLVNLGRGWIKTQATDPEQAEKDRALEEELSTPSAVRETVPSRQEPAAPVSKPTPSDPGPEKPKKRTL